MPHKSFESVLLIVFHQGRYIAASSSADDTKKLLAAGFTHDHQGALTAFDPRAGAKLRDYCDDDARKRIDRSFIKVSPWLGPLPHPPHLTPRPFQTEGALWALSREPASYLAMDPGCIDGDATIVVNRGGCARKMKLSDLFYKFHGGVSFAGPKLRMRKLWDGITPTKISSVNLEGVLSLNRVVDVIDRGVRPVVEIVAYRGEKKYVLRCTLDHRILVDPKADIWTAAGALKPGDTVKTNGQKFCDRCGRLTDHVSYLYAKHRGKCKTCINSRPTKHGQKGRLDKDGYLHVYGALRNHPRNKPAGLLQHVLKYEAERNGLSYKQWLKAIDDNDLKGRFFVPTGYVIHHRNGIKTDNRPSNLEMLTASEHATRHSDVQRIRGMVVSDAIVSSVTPIAPRRVYDIVMEAPLHNFIADGVAVHNCGKTPTAAMIMNALQGAALYVCPPSLVTTVEAELEKWSWPIQARISTNPTLHPRQLPCTWIVPDTMIHAPELRKEIGCFIRYYRRQKIPVTLFVDEAQRFVNVEARRTRALYYGLVPAFDRTVYLSGTPMPNRPIELYPVLSASAPEVIDFAAELDYGRRYCGAYQDGQGRWDLTGDSNMPELAARMRKDFMYRVRKADVLSEIPPKTEEVIYLARELPTPELRALDQKLRAAGVVELLKAEIAGRLGGEAESLPLSTYRKELGILKAPDAVKFLTEALESTDEAFLVFVAHREVAALLKKGLARFRPSVITGETPIEDRKDLVARFQADPSQRVFIGNYIAAGTGFNLTRATRVVFVEYSWVPGDNDQASDRPHRIGQTAQVHVQYLAYKNSVDCAVLSTNHRKRKVLAHI